MKEKIKNNTPEFLLKWKTRLYISWIKFSKDWRLKTVVTLKNSFGFSWLGGFLLKRGESFVKLYSINQLPKTSVESLDEYPTSFVSTSPNFFLGEKNSENKQFQSEGCRTRSVLKNVYAYGGSNLIEFKFEKGLYDLVQYNEPERFRILDELFIFYRNNAAIIPKMKTESEYEDAIMLLNNYSWNYYHFFWEILVKFEYINKLESRLPLLIDEAVMDSSQFNKVITLMNVNNLPISVVKKNQKVKVKRLVHFSCPNVIPSNFLNEMQVKFEDFLFSKDSILNLRKALLPLKSESEFPKKIFITRKSASAKRQFNETELCDRLTQYGFVSIAPEEYPIEDQISMFNGAEIVIGGSGGAMTNLIFCGEKTNIIILLKWPLMFSIFSTISDVLGNDLQYITEQKDLEKYAKRSNIHENFEIDVNELINLMDIFQRERNKF